MEMEAFRINFLIFTEKWRIQNYPYRSLKKSKKKKKRKHRILTITEFEERKCYLVNVNY